jgi:hypothetical protein
MALNIMAVTYTYVLSFFAPAGRWELVEQNIRLPPPSSSSPSYTARNDGSGTAHRAQQLVVVGVGPGYDQLFLATGGRTQSVIVRCDLLLESA